MDRELRRKPDDCPDDTVLPVVTRTGQREPLKCDPPAPAPPDVFVTPVAAPASTTLPSYVVPVVPVPNTAQTARCSDRANGSTSNQGPGATDAVTTAAATFTQDVALQDIPGLTESQGRFLAGLVDILVILTYTEAQLVSLARLLPSQATWLHAQRTSALTVANAQALALANTLLDCYWNNEQVIVSCADAVGQPAQLGVSNPITVNAGLNAARSRVSQADANDLAGVIGRAQLGCVWVNTAVTVTCGDQGFDTSPPVPGTLIVDIGDTPAPTDAQRGSVTVQAGAVESVVGQAEADDAALELASSLLNCFFTNALVSLSCVDLGKVDTAAGSNTSGNPIVVPAGEVVSFVSLADANTQADALARSALNCFWVNVEKIATCPDQAVGVPPDSVVNYPAAPSSPVYTATIPAGLISSEISQVDANDQADLTAQGQLDCLYCNTVVPAQCVPAGTTTPVNINGSHPDWSRDITTGVAAGVYCADSALTAQSLAESLGIIPIRSLIKTSGLAECTWGNEAVKAKCVSDVGAGIVGKWNPGDRSDLGMLSTPSLNSIVYFAKDSVILTYSAIASALGIGSPTPAQSQAYVNSQAEIQVKSFLNCYWENNSFEARCTAVQLTNVNQLASVYGAFTMPDGASDASPASNRSVSISARLITSNEGKLDAENTALSIAISQLDCWVRNQTRCGSCDGETPNRVTLPGGLVANKKIKTGEWAAMAAHAASLNIRVDAVQARAEAAAGTSLPPLLGRFSLIPIPGSEPPLAELWSTRVAGFGPKLFADRDLPSGPVIECVGAGAVVSFQGQQDADTLAGLMAQSVTSCLYGNDSHADSVVTSEEQNCSTGLVPANTITAPTRAAANSAAAALSSAMIVCPDDLGGGGGGAGGGTDLDCGCYFSATLAVDSDRYLEMTAEELLDVANRTTAIVTVKKRGLSRVVTQDELDNMKPAPVNPEELGGGLWRVNYDKSQSYPLQFSYLLANDDRSFSSWTETMCGDQYIIEKGVAAPDEKWLPDYTYKIYDRGEGFPVPCGAEVGYAPHGGQFTQAYQLKVNIAKELYVVFNGMPKKVVTSFGAPQDIEP